MPRNMSRSQRFALWFWNDFLELKDTNPWTASQFKRYLAEASRALKLDIKEDILKEALNEMKAAGVDVQSIMLPMLWEHHMNGPNWYEWVREKLETPPPIYEIHAYKQWCIQTGNEHLLANVPEIHYAD